MGAQYLLACRTIAILHNGFCPFNTNVIKQIQSQNFRGGHWKHLVHGSPDFIGLTEEKSLQV